MDEYDIPIFKKTYELYKTFYGFRNVIPKQDRYVLWQRCENLILDILENILWASQLPKGEKIPILEKTSLRLNSPARELSRSIDSAPTPPET